MLAIALDEAGVFDSGKQRGENDSKLDLIGGPLFDEAGNEGEIELEKKRIKAFYQTIFYEAEERFGREFKFPKNLHITEGDEEDIEKVANIKQVVSENLEEFLTYGTYKGNKIIDNDYPNGFPDRKGNYNICVSMNYGAGKQLYLLDSNGNLLSDKKGSNRYIHLMSDLVTHMVYQNPLYYKGKNCFELYIATRRSAPILGQYASEYKELGYEICKNDDSNSNDNANDKKKTINQYQIMNSDVIRTMLLTQMAQDSDNSTVIKLLKVKAIQYREELKSNDLFLYLADSICGELTFKLKDENDYEYVISKAKSLIDKDEKKKTPLVFLYCDKDDYFQKAWNAYKKDDYYEVYRNMYMLNKSKDEASKYYDSVWNPILKKIIKENFSPSSLLQAINRLSNTLMRNNLKQSEVKYILNCILENVDIIRDKSTRYQIYDSAIAVYCHMGAPHKSKTFIPKCEELAEYISVDQFARTRNRIATAECDLFDYKSARELVEKNIKMLSVIREFMVSGNTGTKVDFGRIEYAKSLSLAGQIYAFMRQKKAEDYFKNALEMFANDGANYYISLSYLLHYYIDQKDEEKYRKYMEIYTGGYADSIEQLVHIAEQGGLDEGKYTLKYAFYVYIKGLYVFGPTANVSENDLWKEIKTVVGKYGDFFTDHPCSQIYKYLTLFAIKYDDKKKIKVYRERISECNGKNERELTLVYAIELMSELEIDRILKDNDQIDKKIEEVYRLIKNKYPKALKMYTEEVGKWEGLEKIFVYMYA